MDTSSAVKRLTPVYFVSHGGPNIMFDTDHPAYNKLEKIGKEITTLIRPSAIVVFSAHWQASGNDRIEVNTAEFTDLIYDYYGFPDEYYDVKYPSVGSKELGEKVISLLKESGIEAEGVKRGLDHGVFAPFTCMFNPSKNPLKTPLVQVSLFSNEDADKHYSLGAALKKLREENILIIASGMAIHNLRDIRASMTLGGKPMPYSAPFDESLRSAIEDVTSGEERKKKLRELLWVSEARKAHPTFEHLLPIHIAAGAAGDDQGRRTWTLLEMSLGWAQFRFGELPRE